MQIDERKRKAIYNENIFMAQGPILMRVEKCM